MPYSSIIYQVLFIQQQYSILVDSYVRMNRTKCQLKLGEKRKREKRTAIEKNSKNAPSYVEQAAMMRMIFKLC